MHDVIIVTKREPDSTISIIAEPIFLKDVTSTDFECLHRKLDCYLTVFLLLTKISSCLGCLNVKVLQLPIPFIVA